jgi:hypothetical protein
MSRCLHLAKDGRKVVIKGEVEIDNEIVYALFDKSPADQYDEIFERALVLGCYALQLNGTGELLNKVALDLNADLQHLKMLMDLRGLKERSAAVAGGEAELDIVDTLQAYADDHQWADEVTNTGSSVGVIARRKVGDAVIAIAGTDRRIVVESKADKSVALGSPTTVEPLKSKTDVEKKTAYGQGLTALANREADIAIIVHFEDNAHKTVRDAGMIQLIPEQPAIVVVVDRVAGRWEALLAAYSLARALCLAWDGGAERWEAVDLIIKRVARELARLQDIDSQLNRVREAAADILASLDSIEEIRLAIRASLDLMDETVAVLQTRPMDVFAKRELFLEST